MTPLDAVLADPDADAPRLAFADACEAREPERAEFIRLQVETARRLRTGDPSYRDPARRAEQLLAPHRASWVGPIAQRVTWCELYRGFVEDIELDAAQFLATAPELYRLAPVRRLILKKAKPVIAELARSPHLARIVMLVLADQGLDDRDAQALAASPHLGKLVWLDLARNKIGMPGVEALAAATSLPKLRKLALIGNPAGDVREEVAYDALDGAVSNADVSDAAYALEQRFGRKAWLHTVEDLGRELRAGEL